MWKPAPRELPRPLTRRYNFFHLAESLSPFFIFREWCNRRKNIARKEILALLSKKQSGRSLEIPRVSGISPEEFRRIYMYSDCPVIFEGAALEWPAIKEWSLESMRSKYGSVETLLVKIKGLSLSDGGEKYRFNTLSQIVDNIWSRGKMYLRVSPLVSDHPELQAQLDKNWLKQFSNPWSPANGFQFFMGGEGGRTRLHCEIQANIYIMVHGEKRWRLYPTEYAPVFDPPADRVPYIYTEADVYEPDETAYPHMEKLDCFDFVLKPGDILYNPPFVWHDILNLSDSIGVGYRFSYWSGALRTSVTFSLLRMLANNPPLWKSFWYNLKDINLSITGDKDLFKEIYAKFKKREELQKTQP